MASRSEEPIEEPMTAQMGKTMLRAMAGGDVKFAHFKLKDYIKSRYGSIERLKEKAQYHRNWEAQSELAMAYQCGIRDMNIKQDLDSAIEWYERSVQNGNDNPLEILQVGVLHGSKGTPPHQRRALELYLKAFNGGSLQAALNIAEMYRCGVKDVVEKDLEVALKLYRQVAGEEPLTLEVVNNKFYHKALRTYDIDSKTKALKRLYTYYMFGECPEGEAQPLKAMQYLKKAAELGDLKAEKHVAISYLIGYGVPKNLSKAKKWYKPLAEKGDEEAIEYLRQLEEEGIEDLVGPEEDDPEPASDYQQYLDTIKEEIEEDQQLHPLVMKNPTIFEESTYMQFPDSPTAQRYLKALKLVREGLEKLEASSFTDQEAIRLLALGVLYENSISQSYIHSAGSSNFLPSLFDFISQLLLVNANFFEGLLLLNILCPLEQKRSLESHQQDLEKTVALSNLIDSIKKAEPNKPPKKDLYNFEEDYTSWLPELYYHLGCQYIITEHLKESVESFQEALNCCPTYYKAKMSLAYCCSILSTANNDEDKTLASSIAIGLLKVSGQPQDQRIPEEVDFETWTVSQLQCKAKHLLLEYIREAPECDNKYSHGIYHLAIVFMQEEHVPRAVKWRERGENSEKKRLPFMGPVSLEFKFLLSVLDLVSVPENMKIQCSNEECPQKPTANMALKPCPCHKVSYCGRDCQTEDWKEHRKTCSQKKKKKEKK